VTAGNSRRVPYRRRVRGAVAAAVSRAAARAGWALTVSRHEICLDPRPRRSCRDCHGTGGWWVGGPFPEMEPCGCTDSRRTFRLRLRPGLRFPDEHPF